MVDAPRHHPEEAARARDAVGRAGEHVLGPSDRAPSIPELRPVSGAVVRARVRIPLTHALNRERLDLLLGRLWEHRLGLVVAPAGSGKTTLLAQFSHAATVPVAWYRAEGWDADPSVMFGHLETSTRAAVPELGTGWATVEDAARALELLHGGRLLVVVDDFHTLEGTPAEGALERLVDYAPPSVAFLIGSRSQPGFNLSRLRVSGALLEIGGDDLRFRSWEVERLFRDFYGQPFQPEELARLARRTEGWAAGLQLFHLATRGKPPDERRRMLAALGTSSRILREYLTRNVLDQLPDELRGFLVESCVLRRLNGPICDAFLGRRGSGRLLEELERRQIFTHAIDDEGTYRYHEVLRSHLEGVLLERLGEAEARSTYQRAGQVLESAGAVPEALSAYARAEDWEAVRRLAGRSGKELSEESGAWIEALPAAVLRQDPWLALASARNHRAEGRWDAAIEAYQRAEVAFGIADAALACRRERQALATWLDPTPTPSGDWSGLLRLAVAREPGAIRGDAVRLPDGLEALTIGLAALLAGHVAEARRFLGRAVEHPDTTPVLAATGSLAAGIAAALAGDSDADAIIESSVNAAERTGAGWLARVGRAALALRPGGGEGRIAEAAAIRDAFDREGDPWGAALAGLALAWGAVQSGEAPVGELDDAVGRFRRLGAGVLEAWSRGLLALALARSGAPEAREAALQAESVARASGTPGARLYAYLALAAAQDERAGEYVELARAVREDAGLAAPADRAAATPAEDADLGTPRDADVVTAGSGPAQGPAAVPRVIVRCFGGFAISIDGMPVELGALKPRARAVLRLLALHAPAPVHREVLQDALWPDAERATGARTLHVAISSLRGVLEPGVGRGGSTLLVRDADAYRLALPPGSSVDVAEFEAAVATGRILRASGEITGAMVALGRALELHAGDLLPEDGPADWVVERREHCRIAAVEAAQSLAELALLGDEPGTAVQATARGLAVDRYHDPLWRLLIEARDRAGDPVAASRARRSYDEMLTELGVGPILDADANGNGSGNGHVPPTERRVRPLPSGTATST